MFYEKNDGDDFGNQSYLFGSPFYPRKLAGSISIKKQTPLPFLNIFKQQPRTFPGLVKQYNQELCQIHDVSPRGSFSQYI